MSISNHFPRPARHWPDGFDVRTDDLFQTRIRPFIELQMAELAAFDEQRAAWVAEHMPADYQMNYIFSEHAARVANDMRGAALHMGLGDMVAENLYWAMLPHDIGKKALPIDLWDMTGKPDGDLKALRRSHTARGVAIMDEMLNFKHPFVDLMRDIMLHHHEQMDGGGFLGLEGASLSDPVRLACIIESFDGYSIPRYHFGDRDVSPAGVLARMKDEKGDALYDMDLFASFAAYKTRAGKDAHPSINWRRP